jgi:hypothetical protein
MKMVLLGGLAFNAGPALAQSTGFSFRLND